MIQPISVNVVRSGARRAFARIRSVQTFVAILYSQALGYLPSNDDQDSHARS